MQKLIEEQVQLRLTEEYEMRQKERLQEQREREEMLEEMRKEHQKELSELQEKLRLDTVTRTCKEKRKSLMEVV